MANALTGLQAFPKYELLDGPTAVQELKQLNKTLNGVQVFVKRDDVMGIALGGNKLRKLEYLLGDALQQKAERIITVGARQSNHARLTAAAAAKAGLSCELFLTRTVPIDTADYSDNGNIVLENILGARIVDLPAGTNALALAEERAAALKAAGRNAYVMPMGGSSPTGCLGYVHCAQEIQQQADNADLVFDYVLAPNGSSGTHAGLLAGFKALQSNTQVRTYNVLAEPTAVYNNTLEKTNATLQLIAPQLIVTETDIAISNDYRGEAYGIPTAAMLAAVRLLARTEGILLDPVYSGKAFAGMLEDIRQGYYKPGDRILFILTGGTPGLFAYRNIFTPSAGEI
ncbi:D-cysteine desulfhydrase family protein [Chitinophaga pendula]|uniref:D-cysteine desulfhydrase family protein n=1 Tax=Chitinophaga TaxID=79328 RepID=UPI000BB07351|nr:MULTISPECIES: D-cysteine desulfhydrase family protein [Chitinophaga]ASZ13008.1 D-cysteine desulfhydrase [Chitinophaga sp. MD30]UCJ09362.1 D-cysteine desulfhydrase family protein [Chitinophaga pendula]